MCLKYNIKKSLADPPSSLDTSPSNIGSTDVRNNLGVHHIYTHHLVECTRPPTQPEARIATLEDKVTGLDVKIDTLDGKVDPLKVELLEKVDKKIGEMHVKISNLEKCMEHSEPKLEQLLNAVNGRV